MPICTHNQCSIKGEQPIEQFISMQGSDKLCKMCLTCRNKNKKRWHKAFVEQHGRLPFPEEMSKGGHSKKPIEQLTPQYAQSRRLAESSYLREKQNNRCAICCSDISIKATLDHCHKTHQVRGWLCHACNSGLGQFKDSPLLIRRAIEYIRKFG